MASPVRRQIENHLLLGTICLEVNRHRPGRVPSYRVSEWSSRIAEAGFAGVELWEHHASMADDAELDAIKAGPAKVVYFNTYTDFSDADRPRMERAAELIGRLGAAGVKVNFGPDPSKRDEYVRNMRAFLSKVPKTTRLLCECHSGTIAEVPETAAELLAAVGSPERVGAIVHVYSDAARLPQWFAQLGSRLAHGHVVMPDVVAAADLAADAAPLKVMSDHGFAGTFTIEFVEGWRNPSQTIDELWRLALRDRQRLLAASATL